ncbi:tripartite tricarboxylate transporter permease [Afifella pfennigii]|uniref:tripartite tricarboxylate transporter permease n=1 Tax=Afifella pfennigii TaxID=209897 RepID=UPI00068C861A|nr:tripartite tricarboxylate transporter permease [Afifella pfennigii]
MDVILTHLAGALGNLTSPTMLLVLLAGVSFGIVLGALPGFGSSQSLALLFPLTFAMPTDHAIVFFLAIYSAAEYGGSIPAILIRTPGTPAQAVTVIEGYELARKGFANKALKISLFSGVIGGLTSTIIFILSGTTLALIALQFGPGEMFALGIFGLSIIGSFFGRDPARGFLATGIGLLLATVGSSGFGGMRFTFEQAYLSEGLPLVVVIIAFLAGPEAFRLLVEHRKTVEPKKSVLESRQEREKDRVTRADARRLVPTWIRCSLIGTGIGAIPGAGASVGSLIAYSEEKRWSKRGKEFGTGVEEGLAAPETANNAVVAGTLVPSLTLGIPGSGAAAILLSVLISKGVVPGPLLFRNEPLLITTIFVGLLFVNFWLLVIGIFFTRAFALVAKVPRRILGPFVMLLIILGTYAYNTYPAHVVMVLILSLVAYWFHKIEVPVVPIVLAFVMGPIVEENLSRALTIHAGDILVVLTRPITLVILALAIITATYSVIAHRRSLKEGHEERVEEE